MGFLANRPRRAYVVAATPRSGSTLLCETLRATGVAGRPEEPFQRLADTGLPHQPRDYFRGVDDPSLLDLLPPRRVERPIAAADARTRLESAFAEGTTPNGVFGTKLMWGYLGDFLAGARLLDPSLAAAPDADVLRAVLGGGAEVPIVQVLRRDKVGQAISLWRAIQTQRWRDEGEPGAAAGGGAREPVYHRAAIAHLRDVLTAGEESWTAWLAERGIAPLRVVVYEELVPALEPTIRGLLADLGIDEEPAEGFAVPRMRRQSNGTSAEWRERFVAEEGA